MKKLLLQEKLLLLLIFSSFSSFGFSQVTREWVALHEGPADARDFAVAIAVDKAGNVYVTGLVATPTFGSDYRTIKYNPSGELQWEARYSGPVIGGDRPSAIVVDAQSNVYVTGSSGGGETANDYATIKYNSAGIEQWVARYNGPGNRSDDANSVKVDSEGNVYVTGTSFGAGTSLDYATIKYNRNGVLLWISRFDGPGADDLANALALDDAENVYVTGTSSAISTPPSNGLDMDYTTIKYNKNGKLLWVTRYDGPADGNQPDAALAITVDKSGNTYVTGRSTGGSQEDAVDYATVKYDANGVQKWVARYNGFANNLDEANSIAVDSRQDVYVTGFSAADPEQNNFDYATIRYDKNGKQIWVRRYTGPTDKSDLATSLALDGSGNVYVTGRSVSPTGIDFATVKYSRTGLVQWVERFNGAGNAITVDQNNNVYVTGSSPDQNFGSGYATIKYCQQDCPNQLNKTRGNVPITITNEEAVPEINQLPVRFRLFSYPNPVSSMTNIFYELPVDGQVLLEVYDMLGRKIKTLVNADMKAGYYSIRYDASALSNGIYNYRIIAKTNTKVWTHTKKLSVAK